MTSRSIYSSRISLRKPRARKNSRRGEERKKRREDLSPSYDVDSPASKPRACDRSVVYMYLEVLVVHTAKTGGSDLDGKALIAESLLTLNAHSYELQMYLR